MGRKEVLAERRALENFYYNCKLETPQEVAWQAQLGGRAGQQRACGRAAFQQFGQQFRRRAGGGLLKLSMAFSYSLFFFKFRA